MFSTSQWIVWQAQPDPGKPKPRKVPIDPVTGGNINHLAPSSWMIFEVAQSWAATDDSCGVGFVLTANDPYFCIDLDNARDPATGAPTEQAAQVMAMFPGAYMEVSHSGKGYHIFGQGAMPEWSMNKNQSNGMEIYHVERYIALGHHGQGDPDLNWQSVLESFCAIYMGRREQVTPTEWSEGPCDDWSGPTVDIDLIERAMNSRPSMFSNGASFAELWNADVDALSRNYPDNFGGNRPYDASSADAALMAHLAFWTGKDCARMDRLFRQSGLMRPKYEQRKDYGPRTITGAVSRCKQVYRERNGHGTSGTLPAASGTLPAPAGDDPSEDQDISILAPGGVMDAQTQSEWFAGCFYVSSLDKIYSKRRGWLTTTAFDNTYSKAHFIYTYDGNTTKSAKEAFLKNHVAQFGYADQPLFMPESPGIDIVERNGRFFLNTYVEPRFEITNNDVSMFIEWFNKMFPVERDREIILSYMAAIVQYQGYKFQWCPVIQGAQGNGKTALSRIVRYAVQGPDKDKIGYCHTVPASELGDGGLKFNSWVENKIFVDFEEIYTRDKAGIIEALKPYVTNEYIEIQAKGVDQKVGRNCANFIMMTNHKDAIQKTREDRRYAVFYSAHQSVADVHRDFPGDFFHRFYSWLNDGGFAAMAGFLRTYPIHPDFNPAGRCQRAPETSATNAAIRESLGTVEQHVMEAIDESRWGFRGGWVSSKSLDMFLKEESLSTRMTPNKRRNMMESLGYIAHPRLPGGRATVNIGINDQARPYLYINPQVVPMSENDVPKQVVDQFLLAQNNI